jgi:methyltransferase (TIGR00027 family)
MKKIRKVAEPDSTAVRTALWRALHVQIDNQPLVFEDTVGLQLVSPEKGWQQRPDMKYTTRIRASIIARARFMEDLIIEQYNKGISQYVILGSGLDTFAQRHPETASRMQIFEIDQPDTLHWKQARLIQCDFSTPESLHFVPVDFENSSWWDELLKTSFDIHKGTVVTCAGVMLYLTHDAIMETLYKLTKLPKGSKISITFNLPVELVDDEDKPLIEMAIKGARESGTPMISFFSPEEILKMARKAGFTNPATISTKNMEQLYFANRKDNLIPASGEIILSATV